MEREPKLIGSSPQIKELRKFIKMAARSDASVLLLGETGVGKEVAARKIHLLSRRRSKPFLKRDLDRATVKQILSLGLKDTRGSYKKLLPLFNMSLDEKEYQRFMKILRVHRLR
jgi:hypothetical protein